MLPQTLTQALGKLHFLEQPRIGEIRLLERLLLGRGEPALEVTLDKVRALDLG